MHETTLITVILAVIIQDLVNVLFMWHSRAGNQHCSFVYFKRRLYLFHEARQSKKTLHCTKVFEV